LAEIIIADGFSCREQIAEMTDRQALHMAEVIELGLRHGSGGPGGLFPESESVQEHAAAVRKSKVEAAAALGGLAAASVLAMIGLAKRHDLVCNSTSALQTEQPAPESP
jgi:hypothetical protein